MILNVKNIPIQDPKMEKDITRWDYRIVYKMHGDKDQTVAIHEVYYKDGNPVACTEKPIAPLAESSYDLVLELERMKKAFELPALNFDSFFREKEKDNER